MVFINITKSDKNTAYIYLSEFSILHFTVQNGKQIGVAWHPDSSHVLVRATSERLD